jgi:hypothetical protein
MKPAPSLSMSIPRPHWLVTASICCLITTAASPVVASVLVLSFQGPDAAKVQATVSTILRNSGHSTAPGDTTYEDAAAVLGCNAGSDECGEEVCSTLEVEEIVFGTIAKNGDVVIFRVARGKPRQQVHVRTEPGQSVEAALAPALQELFNESTAAERPADPPLLDPTMPPDPLVTPAAMPAIPVSSGPTDPDRRYVKWSIVAWAGSGAAGVATLLFWIRAGSLQDELDRTTNAAARRDLDDRANAASTVGTSMAVASVGLAGLGTLFWIMDRRQRRASGTSIGPMLVPGGAGVLVTLGI